MQLFQTFLFHVLDFIFSHIAIIGVIVFFLLVSQIKIPLKDIKKLFTRRIFKIDKEHKTRDIFEIFALFLIAVFILLLLLFDGFVLGVLHYQNNSCKHHKLTYYDVVKIQTQSAFHTLVNMTNHSKSEDDLFEYILKFKNIPNRDIYNIAKKKNGKIRPFPAKYVKSEQTPDGIDVELSQKPCFYLANSLFFINSYKNGCKHTDFEHPENSDCYITVDLNGFTPPNKLLEVDIDLNNRSENYSTIANGDEIIFVIASREDNSLYPMLSNKYRQLILKR